MGEPFYQSDSFTFTEIKNILLRDYSFQQSNHPSELVSSQVKSDEEIDEIVRISINHFLGNEYYKKNAIQPNMLLTKLGSIRGYLTFIHQDLLDIFIQYMAKSGYNLNPLISNL